ncbi:transposase [Candidatus Daviesbacteria bacterium RIFCSPLOWO2_02_FULL_36_8]|uniref:Transposase n=1 Tax=Candidatus Daviesbacteria bacterium RIFCSPLOWO2_02_FULL_36_8 TaxID=1797793 RepID=A0A1F5MGK7_9BACT|nr:MAG: transposase [Candidatus Daviesbacteria bacterium RIFCSPLOWO2_02_FULL_36_8]
MYTLSIKQKVQVISSLVEGNSIRATCRMTGAAKGTVTRLLVSIGKACEEYQDIVLRNLPCKQIQCDEIWSFCYAKEKNVPKEYKSKFGFGDVWTWVAIDAQTKLVPSWSVGLRYVEYAEAFIRDLKSRLANRVQLTTDGLKLYLWAVENAFGSEVDYAMLIKIYGQQPDGEKRYSPADCIATEKRVLQGKPDVTKISTSYIERQNLTMRMNMRRFTRLTNAFSKKIENLESAVALHFMYYNFCRPHKTLNLKKSLGITPAMAAGVTNKIWKIEDIIYLANLN